MEAAKCLTDEFPNFTKDKEYEIYDYEQGWPKRNPKAPLLVKIGDDQDYFQWVEIGEKFAKIRVNEMLEPEFYG